MQKTNDKNLICDSCYNRLDCEKIPKKDGRCALYLKEGKIKLNKELEVNPMDTIEFNYDDLKLISKIIEQPITQKIPIIADAVTRMQKPTPLYIVYPCK